jgi:hypothetical protein
MKLYNEIYTNLSIYIRTAVNAVTSPGATTFGIVCAAITAVVCLI